MCMFPLNNLARKGLTSCVIIFWNSSTAASVFVNIYERGPLQLMMELGFLRFTDTGFDDTVSIYRVI